jgi:hypothetical protein
VLRRPLAELVREPPGQRDDLLLAFSEQPPHRPTSLPSPDMSDDDRNGG